MKKRSFRLFIILALLAPLPAPAKAADPVKAPPEDFRAAHDVFDSIVRSIGDGRSAPPLVIGEKGPVAAYYPDENVVSMDPKFYALCKSFGADFQNALSVVFGHELAHFYRSHAWVNEFGIRLEGVGKAPKAPMQNEVLRIETEADDFGGFYSHMAGYDNLAVAPKVLDAIYQFYKFGNAVDGYKLHGYPTLEDRKTIAQSSRDHLKKLIPIFEAGNRLLILKIYEPAALCFSHIAKNFPSREVLNNAGVAKALQAIALRDKDQVPYAFPFELDPQSRLASSWGGGRGLGSVFDRGDGASSDILGDSAGSDAPIELKKEERPDPFQALLTQAKEKFEQAALKDPTYVAALVNLSCVYSLQGEASMAAAVADKAVKMAEKNGELSSAFNGKIAKGIALAVDGKKAEARAVFEGLKKTDLDLADLNLEALGGSGGLPHQRAEREEISSDKEEFIGGSTVSGLGKMAFKDAGTAVPLADGSEEKMLVKSDEDGDLVRLCVSLKGSAAFVAYTKPSYAGSTPRGIHLGSSDTEIRAKYGFFSRIVPTSGGDYLVYERSNIAFFVDAKGTLRSWMIFDLEAWN